MYRKLIIIIILLSGMSFAQQRWERIYDYGWEGHFVLQISSGDYIVTGIHGFPPGILLTRISLFGDSLWHHSLGGGCGYSVQKTNDKGYIIVGYTYSAGSHNIYLVKTDSLGTSYWTKTYGGTDWDYGYSVQQTVDNGYIVVGHTASFGVGGGDIYLIRTDSLGDTLWTKTYGGSAWDGGYSVQKTSDGGYVVAGWVSDAPGAGYVHLLKTNSSGDSVWAKRFGRGYGYSVANTSDGGYIVTGSVLRGTYTDVYLIKTNSNGDSIWSKTYNGGFDDVGYSVQQTTDGGYIIAGQVGIFPDPLQYDVYLIKTNDRGDTTWTRTWHRTGALENVGYSVRQTLDGGYIIAGETGWPGALYLIKTDAQGNSYLEESYESSANQQKSDLDLRVQNPVRGNLMIQYFSARNQEITIDLYDLTGRKVVTVFSGFASAGNHSRIRSLSLPGGVYFLRLTSAKESVTKKVVLIR